MIKGVVQIIIRKSKNSGFIFDDPLTDASFLWLLIGKNQSITLPNRRPKMSWDEGLSLTLNDVSNRTVK